MFGFGLALMLASGMTLATTLEWEPPTECVDGSELVLSHFTIYRDRQPLTVYPSDATSAVLLERVEACYEVTATGICGDTDTLSESWYSNRGCTWFPASPESLTIEVLH